MVSAKLGKLMAGWKKERKTYPRRNTLASRSAAQMTPQQIRNILSANLVLYPNTARNVEHRMRNLAVQNNNMRAFMASYLSRQLARNSKRRNVARSVFRRWASKTKKN